MTKYLQIFIWLTLLSIELHAADGGRINESAERFVLQQLGANNPDTKVNVGKIDVSRLPECELLEAFLPPGTRLIGRIHVGVRCLQPSRWSVLVPAQISIMGNYVTLNRALAAGQVIQANDLTIIRGDIASLPTGAITDTSPAIGKLLRNSLGAGQVLRSDQLLAPQVIRQGQTVKVISTGSGFSISSEGLAINSASEGQTVQVRMPSGQTVSGLARKDGSVEIAF